MAPKLDVDIRIEDPPHRFFSPLSPTLDAAATVKFGSDTDHITEIRMGFSGTVYCVYHDIIVEHYWQDGRQRRRRVRKDYNENHTLFDNQIQWCECKGREFHKGEELNKSAQFTFPSDSLYLPSSASNVGSYGDYCGEISIHYCVYVTVHYTRRVIGGNSSKTYDVKVPFQGQWMNYTGQPPLTKEYSLSQVFAAKVKPFYYDESLHALVPSALEKAHTHTRSIRSLFSDKYKKEKWAKQQQDVRVDCIFEASTLCNILSPLEGLLSIKFQVSADSLEPDFCYEGQSTGLGKFDVLGFGIHCHHCVNMVSQGHPYTSATSEPIVSTKLEPGTAQIDVKDFTMKDKRLYEFQLPETFFSAVCSSPLIDRLKKPCLMSGTAQNFECMSWLKIKLVLGSSNKSEKLVEVYEKVTDGTFYIG